MSSSLNGLRTHNDTTTALFGAAPSDKYTYEGEEGNNKHMQTNLSTRSWIKCIERTVRSRYFYASAVYVAYSCAMLSNDYVGDTKERNDLYFKFAVVHLIDAFLYLWAWDDKGYLDPYCYPEYLNILGAGLYLWSACLYPLEFSSDDDVSNSPTDSFYACRRIELSAAVVEIFASIGWIVTWWWGLKEKYETSNSQSYRMPPGIGLSLEDSDFHACWTIMLAALLYFVYNVQVLDSPERYATNFAYVWGDIFYLLNSLFYFAAALRDYGWFDSLPLPSALWKKYYQQNEGKIVVGGGGGGVARDSSQQTQSLDAIYGDSQSCLNSDVGSSINSSNSYVAFSEEGAGAGNSSNGKVKVGSNNDSSPHSSSIIIGTSASLAGGSNSNERSGNNGDRGNGLKHKTTAKNSNSNSNSKFDPETTASLLHEPLTPPSPSTLL